MKKIFTLMIAMGSLTAVFAQGHSSRNDSRDVILGRNDNNVYGRDNNSVYNSNGPRTSTYSFSEKERDQMIKQVNKDFDKQIKAVQKSRTMRQYEKDRQIRMLEAQRTQKIREITDRFDSRWNTSNRKYRGRNNW